jgi:hypothetical protein
MSVPAVDWGRIREALEEAVGRVVGLVGAVRDPEARGTGEWTAAETAAHLTHSFGVNRSLILGSGFQVPDELSSPDALIESISLFNEANLQADPERDLRVLGPRIGQIAREVLDRTADAAGDEPVTWLGGAKLSISAVACHMIGETLLHGSDIARGNGVKWTVPGPSAALVFQGFALAMIDGLDPRTFVDQAGAAGERAVVDMRVRGAAPVLFVLEDRALGLADPGTRRVDCRVSVDAATNFQMGWGRMSPLRAMARGRLVAWGRRPWKAATLTRVIRTP